MVGWHHRLNGHRFGWTLGVGDGQGGLACCDSWDCKELDMTEWLNGTELKVSLRLLNWGCGLSDVLGGFKVSTTGGLEAEWWVMERHPSVQSRRNQGRRVSGWEALVWNEGRGQGSLTLEGGAEIVTPGQGDGVRLCQVGKNFWIDCLTVVMQSKNALFWEWAVL